MDQSFPVSRSPGGPLVSELLEFASGKSLWATFAGIQQHCGGRGRGDAEVVAPDNPKVVLWRGLSDEPDTAITALCEGGMLDWHDCAPVCYWPRPLSFDMRWVTWPIEQEYETPHWLLILFRPGPSTRVSTGEYARDMGITGLPQSSYREEQSAQIARGQEDSQAAP